MARKTLGTSPTERFQMMITADEVSAIDDWRYANKVPSRSEAVRQLVALGAAAPDLLEALKHCVIERDEWLEEARAAIAKAEGRP